MTILPGAKNVKPNRVLKFVNSLYGLEQINRKWNERLTTFRINHRYKQANAYVSLFTKQNQKSFTIKLVYVYDVILEGNSLQDLGQLKYFLGK